jgi:ADP-ribose pyrophosphatase
VSFPPIEDEPLVPELEKSRTVFRGAIWDVKRETFRYNGDLLTRDFVCHSGAAAVLAMNDREEVLLIQQYRHAIRSRNWEIPAGLLDVPGETPRDCAARELLEEADLQATVWDPLVTLHTSPGGSDEVVYIYLATELSAGNVNFNRSAEEADIQALFVPMNKAVKAIAEGRVRNQILVSAVLAAYASRVESKIELQ